MDQPLLIITSITYNHAKFLRKCLDGFLAQQTSFSWYALVHDDCSTDGTTDILREYAEKYPDKIVAMYEEENQFHKGDRTIARKMYAISRNAKYTAVCEGDDYWTDPYKLQKQVDFLEAHPEYSVCFTRCQHVNAITGAMRDDAIDKIMPNDADGVDIDIDTFFSGWFTHPLTMVYRNSMFDYTAYVRYRYYRDTHMIYHLLKNGKGRILNFYSGIRTIHDGGISSMIPASQAIEDGLHIAQELYDYNYDQYTKRYLISISKWALEYTKPFSCGRWKFSARLFALQPSIIAFCKNLVRKGYV